MLLQIQAPCRPPQHRATTYAKTPHSGAGHPNGDQTPTGGQTLTATLKVGQPSRSGSAQWCLPLVPERAMVPRFLTSSSRVMPMPWSRMYRMLFAVSSQI